MSTLDVRFEQVSEGVSLLVFANVAAGWKQLKNNFGFYGFAHEEYEGDDLVTVRVWVNERPPRLDHTDNSFPLDLQSTGSSPSKALTFKLTDGRLAMGTYLSTVFNSRNGGKPGFYEDSILIARHGSVDYWLRFYAAINEELSEPPIWIEHDLSTGEGALSGPDGIHGPTPAIEERLTQVSMAVDTLEGRVGALMKDFEGRIEGSLQAFQGKVAKQAEDLEKLARNLGGQWSQQYQKQAEAAVEKLRGEMTNTGLAAVEESKRQLASLQESKQQLASLAEAKLASFGQAAASVPAGAEAEQKQLKSQYPAPRKELEDLLVIRPNGESPYAERRNHPRRRGFEISRRAVVSTLVAVTGILLLVNIVYFLGVYLWPHPVLHLRPDAPSGFVAESPNWSAKRRLREEELAQAYWRVAVTNLQEKYPFGSELPGDPPAEFQVEQNYVPPAGAIASSDTRDRYWEELRKLWVQRESWVESYEAKLPWVAPLRHVWEQIRARFV